MSDVRRATFRLTAEYAHHLESLAAATGRPRAEIIRKALETYLDNRLEINRSSHRIAQTTEFIQVVMDLIVSRDMPDKRDAILAKVTQRLEQFHGAV